MRELIVSSQKIGTSSPNFSGTKHPFAEHTAASLVFFPFVQHPGLDQPPGWWLLSSHPQVSGYELCLPRASCHSVQSPRQPSLIRSPLYLLSLVALLVGNELVPVFIPPSPRASPHRSNVHFMEKQILLFLFTTVSVEIRFC